MRRDTFLTEGGYVLSRRRRILFAHFAQETMGPSVMRGKERWTFSYIECMYRTFLAAWQAS